MLSLEFLLMYFVNHINVYINPSVQLYVHFVFPEKTVTSLSCIPLSHTLKTKS